MHTREVSTFCSGFFIFSFFFLFSSTCCFLPSLRLPFASEIHFIPSFPLNILSSVLRIIYHFYRHLSLSLSLETRVIRLTATEVAVYLPRETVEKRSSAGEKYERKVDGAEAALRERGHLVVASWVGRVPPPGFPRRIRAQHIIDRSRDRSYDPRC